MDKNPKFKIRSRHRKKNERKSLVAAPSKEKEPSGDSASRQREQETPVKATGSKPIADLHSCYQFIDSEPVIVWGSPHVSPSYEVRAKQLCTTSTPQHRPAGGKERFQRPMRSLIKGTGSPSQFLRDLMDFSEQFKGGEKVMLKDQPSEPFPDLSCSTEVPLSVEVSGAALLGDAEEEEKSLPPPPSPVYRPCQEELEQIKRDNLQELFDDADDDVMLRCSQEVEEIIRKVSCKEIVRKVSYNEMWEEVATTPRKKGGKKQSNMETTPKNGGAGGSSGRKAPENIFKILAEECGVRQQRTPKNRQTPKRAGGSSRKKGGSDTTPLSEGRRSLRLLRGGAATTTTRPQEDLLDAVGGDSFEDVLRNMLEDDFVVEPPPAAKDSPRRKLLPSSKTLADPSSAGGRRKSPRLLKVGGEAAVKEKSEDILRRMMDDNPPARNGGPPPTVWESFRSEDMDESDLAKALDFVESQTIKSSPPLRCTPDEILQKKLEAKRRLAKKKLSRSNNNGAAFLRPKR